MSERGRPKSVPFPTLRAAREAIVKKAEGIWERYEAMIAMAVAAGDYETANDAYKFLLTHMPTDGDGVRLLDPSVDKQGSKKGEGKSLPAIQIGLAIGGVQPAQKTLPQVVAVDIPQEEDPE